MQNNIFMPYKADTTVPPYLPFPRFLLTLNLSNDAKVLYALLFDQILKRRFADRKKQEGK